MKTVTRRDVLVALPGLASLGIVDAGEAQDSAVPTAPTVSALPVLSQSQALDFDKMPARKQANGGESRNVIHGALATGEHVNVHESMQPVGVEANPQHAIQHSEFVLVREGMLEFEREGAPSQTVGPGGVIYVTFGTKHTVKNVGDVPAKYFVVAIGGDVK
jgi:mannose-6-phosphate isomerase-like protein (cupin superfamily)